MDKIKEEIPVKYEQPGMCRLCLSTDRRLSDVSRVMFAFNLVTDWESAAGVLVCWECRARLLSIHNFKLQAAWAKKALEAIKMTPNICFKPVTNLKCYTKTCYDEELVDNADCITGEPITVKIEDSDLPIQDDIPNDDDNIDEFSSMVEVWSEPIDREVKQIKIKKKRGRKQKNKKKEKDIKLKTDKFNDDDIDISSDKYIESYTISEEELSIYRRTRMFTHKFRISEYKCHTCMLRFVNEHYYNKHNLLHSPEAGPHECDICNLRFESQQLLSTHRKTHFVLLKCLRADCTFVHHRAKIMKAHQTTHKTKPATDVYTTDRYECDYCGRSYKLRKRLCSHMRKHKRQVMCEVCGYKAPDSSALRKHNLAHLDPSFRPHECQICNKRFTSKHQLTVHTRIHTGERFICESCGARFRDIYNLSRHNRLRHNIGAPVVPKKCVQPRTKSFFTNSYPDGVKRENIKVPKYMTQIGETNEYHCNICDVSMTHDAIPNHCVAHRKKHQTFHCKDCNKTFNQACNYEKHMATQHCDDRPHQCNICGATFKIKPNLKIHMSIHSDDKPFQCDQCNSSFKRRANLWTHKLVHKGEKPHQCNICGARFLMKGNLNGHMKVHTKETPYECGVCGQSFPWNRNLKNHLKVHEMEQQVIRPLHQL